jgi:hypothetical protein
MWLSAEKGTGQSHPSLFLGNSGSIAESLSKAWAEISIIRVPEIVVLEFGGIDASRIERNQSLTICGSKYRLNSVICSLNIADVIGDTMIEYQRNKVNIADRIEGPLSDLFYGNCDCVPQLQDLSATEQHRL